MKRSKLSSHNDEWFKKYHTYKLYHYSEFDYSLLKRILTITRAGKGERLSFADCVIMADTETSKSKRRIDNHICAWTISIRAYHQNICTLYGHKPSTMVNTLLNIHSIIGADRTIIYFHNLGFDWVGLRKFMFSQWGNPVQQLNTKPYYPILIEFANGIQIRDSYILSQRSLEKWANDLEVEHRKAVGKWDYDLIRNQDYNYSDDELQYIEYDTLAGVECLDFTMQTLNKKVYSMPYTATGIPRSEMRKRGSREHAHDDFLRQALTYEQQCTAENWVYHGGYTQGNRHTVNWILNDVTAYDFSSSYPFCLLAYKFPAGKFEKVDDKSPAHILKKADDYAYMFKFIAYKIQVKDNEVSMPAIQYSKCINTINAVTDNGRVLEADYLEIYLTETDLQIIAPQYNVTASICTDVLVTYKDYLPRWFTDYVYECYEDKTRLKGGDPVLYSIAKAKLNSLYGMCCQKPVKNNIVEDYSNGEYSIETTAGEEDYNKFVHRYNSILPYQVGIWTTSTAMKNIFTLGSYAGTWLYSDTDSCYGMDWNVDGINAYNEHCKELLKANGYEAVIHNGREYFPGIAELDGHYKEFICVGSKRYAVRCDDDSIKITVAGVPKKKGALCLNNDLRNFRSGLIFSGEITGKKTHTHIIADEIYIDEDGNECGDSIDLSPCDYLLSDVIIQNIDELFYREVEDISYEEL